MLKGKKVVTPKTFVPGAASALRRMGLGDSEVKRDKEVGAVESEEDKI